MHERYAFRKRNSEILRRGQRITSISKETMAIVNKQKKNQIKKL